MYIRGLFGSFVCMGHILISDITILYKFNVIKLNGDVISLRTLCAERMRAFDFHLWRLYGGQRQIQTQSPNS